MKKSYLVSLLLVCLGATVPRQLLGAVTAITSSGNTIGAITEGNVSAGDVLPLNLSNADGYLLGSNGAGAGVTFTVGALKRFGSFTTAGAAVTCGTTTHDTQNTITWGSKYPVDASFDMGIPAAGTNAGNVTSGKGNALSLTTDLVISDSAGLVNMGRSITGAGNAIRLTGTLRRFPSGSAVPGGFQGDAVSAAFVPFSCDWGKTPDTETYLVSVVQAANTTTDNTTGIVRMSVISRTGGGGVIGASTESTAASAGTGMYNSVRVAPFLHPLTGAGLCVTTRYKKTGAGAETDGTTQNVEFWSFTTTAVAKTGDYIAVGADAFAAEFRPSGSHIAIAYKATGAGTTYNLRIASLNADGSVANASTVDIPLTVRTAAGTADAVPATVAIGPNCLSWSPDGRYLAVAVRGNATSGDNNSELQVYEVDAQGRIATDTFFSSGAKYTKPRHVAAKYAGAAVVSWYPSQKDDLIAVGTYAAITGNEVEIFRLTRDPFTLTDLLIGDNVAQGITAMDWNASGDSLAVVTASTTGLRLYPFIFAAAPAVPTLVAAVSFASAASDNYVKFNRSGTQIAHDHNGANFCVKSLLSTDANDLVNATQVLASNLSLVFSNDVEFNGLISISEAVAAVTLTIDCQGHEFRFTDKARIFIGTAGATNATPTLIFKNAIIKGVRGADQAVSGSVTNKNVIDSIRFQTTTPTYASTLILDNSILIPDTPLKFTTGTINLIGEASKIDSRGFAIDYATTPVDGTAGVKLVVEKAGPAAQTSFGGSMAFKSVLNMTGDMNLRNANFSAIPNIVGNGYKLGTGFIRIFPSDAPIQTETTSVIPLAATETTGALAVQIDSIDFSQDPVNPLCVMCHKGNNGVDSGKIRVSCFNRLTEKLVNLGTDKTLTTTAGVISDVAWRPRAPFVYDSTHHRHHIAALNSSATTTASNIIIYPYDVLDSFYNAITDISTPNYILTPDYTNVATAGAFGTALSTISFSNHLGTYCIPKSMAWNPAGDKLAVIFSGARDAAHAIASPVSPHFIALYSIDDAGAVGTDSAGVIELAASITCYPTSGKTRALNWSADGTLLFYSSYASDAAGTFLKEVGTYRISAQGALTLYKTGSKAVGNTTTTAALVSAVHPVENLIAVGLDHNNGTEAADGIRLFSFDPIGTLTELKGVVATVGSALTTVFNSLQWHPSGSLLVAGTSQGTYLIPYDVTAKKFKPGLFGVDLLATPDGGLSNTRNIKSAYFAPDGQILVRHRDSGAAHSVVTNYFAKKTDGVFANLGMVLENNLTFAGNVTISEDTVINCNGKVLQFSPNATMTIAAGKKLTITNGLIKGLRGYQLYIADGDFTDTAGEFSTITSKIIPQLQSIIFEDSSAQLVLDGCSLDHSADIAFSKGQIQILNGLKVIGAGGIIVDGIARWSQSGAVTFSGGAGLTLPDQNRITGVSALTDSLAVVDTVGDNAVAATTWSGYNTITMSQPAVGDTTGGVVSLLAGGVSLAAATTYTIDSYGRLSIQATSAAVQAKVKVTGYVIVTMSSDPRTTTIRDNTVLTIGKDVELEVADGATLIVQGCGTVVIDGGTLSLGAGSTLQIGQTASAATTWIALSVKNNGRIRSTGNGARLAFAHGYYDFLNTRGKINFAKCTTSGGIGFNRDANNVLTTDGDLRALDLSHTELTGPSSITNSLFHTSPNAIQTPSVAVSATSFVGNVGMQYTTTVAASSYVPVLLQPNTLDSGDRSLFTLMKDWSAITFNGASLNVRSTLDGKPIGFFANGNVVDVRAMDVCPNLVTGADFQFNAGRTVAAGLNSHHEQWSQLQAGLRTDNTKQ